MDYKADNPLLESEYVRRRAERRLGGASMYLWAAFIAILIPAAGSLYWTNARAVQTLNRFASARSTQGYLPGFIGMSPRMQNEMLVMVVWTLAMALPIVRVSRGHGALRDSEGMMESLYLSGVRAQDVLKPIIRDATMEGSILLFGVSIGIALVPYYLLNVHTVLESRRSGFLGGIFVIHLFFPVLVFMTASAASYVQSFATTRLGRLLDSLILSITTSTLILVIPLAIARANRHPTSRAIPSDWKWNVVFLSTLLLFAVAAFFWFSIGSKRLNDRYWETNLERRPAKRKEPDA